MLCKCKIEEYIVLFIDNLLKLTLRLQNASCGSFLSSLNNRNPKKRQYDILPKICIFEKSLSVKK